MAVATSASPDARAGRLRLPSLSAAAVATGASVAALTVLAALLRSRAWAAPLWIDEGISVGIASHPLSAIPSVLVQDGSPPLYYLLLHVWMAAFGQTESATHALSALFAVLAVPAAAWALAPVAGAWASVSAAAIVALDPYVGLYADETRMYSMVLFLALLVCGTFVRAFLLRRRVHARWFALALAALLYTHGWGLFLGGAAGLAYLLALARSGERRALLVDGVVGFGGAALLFAPWVPALLDQAAHTGAPWSHRPSDKSLRHAMSRMLGGRTPERLLLVGALAGLVVGALRRRRDLAAPALALAILAVASLLAAFAYSRWGSPAWATRYFVVVLAPLALLIALALGRLGPLALALIAAVALVGWQGRPSSRTLERKSDARAIARVLGPRLSPGDVVFSTQPEQVPVLRYYLPRGLVYWTPLGPVRDSRVMDWRDAMARLDRARYGTVAPALLRAARGRRLLLVQPRFSHPDAPWTRRVAVLARRWGPMLRARLHRIAAVVPRHGYSRSTLGATLLGPRRTLR